MFLVFTHPGLETIYGIGFVVRVKTIWTKAGDRPIREHSRAGNPAVKSFSGGNVLHINRCLQVLAEIGMKMVRS
jgi:hypothetical protein